MSLLLNVPFSEKDIVKALGANWNPDFKKWFVTDKKNYYKFTKWFNSSDTDLIICNYLYIVESKQDCFRCQHPTTVVSLAADTYVLIGDNRSELFEGEMHLIHDIFYLPYTLEQYLKEKYNYYFGYSKTTHLNYYGNHCNNCGVLQGDYYLYSEPDSPFFFDSIEKIQQVKISKIKLKHDLELKGVVGWGSEDYLLRDNVTVKNLDLNLYEKESITQLER